MMSHRSKRITVLYAVCTGITVAMAYWFVAELDDLIDYFPITILIVSIVILIPAAMYFFTRWRLTQVIVPEAKELVTLEDVKRLGREMATGDGDLTAAEKRKAIGALIAMAERIAPSVWFLITAGSILGAAVAVVGLINAAVMYKQTERIDAQTEVMTSQYLSDVSNGLVGVNTTLQSLAQAMNLIGDLKLRDDALAVTTEDVTGTRPEQNNQISPCADGTYSCSSELSALAKEILASDRATFQSIDLSGYRNLASIYKDLLDTMDLQLPYQIEGRPLFSNSSFGVGVDLDPEFVISSGYQLVAQSVAVCGLSTSENFERAFDNLFEVGGLFTQLGELGLLDEQGFQPDSPPSNTIGNAIGVQNTDTGPSFDDMQSQAGDLDNFANFYKRRYQRLGGQGDPQVIGLQELSALISANVVALQGELSTFEAACMAEREKVLQTRANITTARDNYLRLQENESAND